MLFRSSGIVGVTLDTFGVRVTLRFVFPALLGGWKGFGPIGVAMSMMTTSGVIAVLWVATACLGAVLWERFAPEQEVVASQQLVTPRFASSAATRSNSRSWTRGRSSSGNDQSLLSDIGNLAAKGWDDISP